MSSQTRKIGCLVVAFLVSLFMYTFLHEFGHLVVALWCGSTITEFSILFSHVSFYGGNYNDLSLMVLHVSGILLPVLVAFGYFLFYKDSKNMFYQMFSYIFCIMPICSLLAWVVIPIAYIFNQAPVYDDVTKFLDVFTKWYHPVVISFVALLLIIILVRIMFKKELFLKMRNILNG